MPSLDRSRVGPLVCRQEHLGEALYACPFHSRPQETKERDTGVLPDAAGRLRAQKQQPGAPSLCRTVAVKSQCCTNKPQWHFRAEYKAVAAFCRAPPCYVSLLCVVRTCSSLREATCVLVELFLGACPAACHTWCLGRDAWPGILQSLVIKYQHAHSPV